MVIPHLRVNYLTRNKWLGNNLEDGDVCREASLQAVEAAVFVSTGRSTERYNRRLLKDGFMEI